MLDTILIISEQSCLHIPLILGAYISIALMKIPDLSIESAYVFGAICGAQTLMLMQELPLVLQIPLVICASIFGGMCVGLTSSLLTKKAQLPHLLSSILTFGIFHGLNQFISNAYVSLSQYNNVLNIASFFARHPEITALTIISLLLIIIGYFFLQTQLGYSFAIYGSNPAFFEQYDISTAYVFIIGLLLSNGLAGFSGYLFAHSNGFAEINMGFGKALLCITSLILGKTLFRTNKPFSIVIPVFGTVCYFTLQQLLLKVGFNLKYFTAVQAVVVLVLLLTLYKRDYINTTNHLGV